MPQIDDTGGVEGQFVHANGLKIFYEEYGSGVPLILLHGAMSTGAVWKPYVSHLSSHFKVIVPDARGHGRTDNPSGEIRTLQLADDVVALINVLNLEKPFLCGWSGGGDTALDVGIRYPDLASGLVLGGVTYRASEAYFETIKAFGLEGPGQVNTDQTEKAVPHLVEIWQAAHSQEADYWKTLLRQLSYEMIEPHTHSAEDFQEISVPTLVITGDRDQFLPLGDQIELYQLISNAELAVIPQADHFVTRTKIELFASIVLEFLLRQSGQADTSEG